MKALSIQQPWAWLIVNGYKDIENRDWPTRGRGRILIHAGKKIDTLALNSLRRLFPEIPFPASFETGGIVGEANVIGCVTDHSSAWFEGVYGFVLRDAKPLPFRAFRGMLGFFDVPDEPENPSLRVSR